MTRLLPTALAAIAPLVIAISVPTLAKAQAIESSLLESFGVLAGSAVTNVPSPGTIINGNVGVSPGSAVTGFPPGVVIAPGTISSNDASDIQAQIDLINAFNTLSGEPTTISLTGHDLGGLVLTPGVYQFASSAQLTGKLTLDGLGNPNAVFIFKIGSTLTTASASSVVLINGAQGAHVFFRVGSSATLGTTTQFAGDILALASITLDTGAQIDCGAALAHTGAVSLDDNQITVCKMPKGTVGPGMTPVTTIVTGSGSPKGNELAVAAALDAFVAHGGKLPPEFEDLISFLSPAQIAAALTQLSGEVGSAVAPAGIQAMDSFMTLVSHRFDSDFGQGPSRPRTNTVRTLDYGPEDSQDLRARSAFASFDASDPRLWNSWAAAYGEEGQTIGDVAAGTHDRFASVLGIAGGLDYRVTPNTILGVALSGGETSFNLSDNLGSGHGNLFQAAIYGRTNFGPADAAYVATTLAYGWDGVSTDRFVTVAGVDELTAQFSAQDVAGQIEGGYRLHMPNTPGLPGDAWFIPYAALRGQAFYTPAYSERAASGSSAFALAYQAQTTTTGRTELGTRVEEAVPVPNGELLLDARLAWAHYIGSNPAVTAMFQALPGSSFTVNGAATEPNSLVVSAGTEMRFDRAYSIVTSFDGEFADGSQAYGGSVWLRHVW
jgi:uncharacterized protein with beta-barrel porin domain